MKTDKKNAPGQNGFTIMEALAALFIFSMAMTAIQFFLTSNIKTARSIENNYTASLLAQEGMEAVRNIRDSEWFASGTFGNNLPNGNWNIQWNSTALLSSADVFIKKDSATGLFSYNSGADTIFKRQVNISTVRAGEKKVVVTVSWTENGSIKTLSAEERLFDWLQ